MKQSLGKGCGFLYGFGLALGEGSGNGHYLNYGYNSVTGSGDGYGYDGGLGHDYHGISGEFNDGFEDQRTFLGRPVSYAYYLLMVNV